MGVYILICLSIFLVSYITRNKTVVCLFTSICLWGLLTLRNLEMGLNDTLGTYQDLFRTVQMEDFNQIPSSRAFPSTFVPYALFTKFCTLFSSDYRVFVSFLAALTVIPVICTIWKYSTQVTLSLFLYIGFFYCYDFYLLRQTLALSIVISICYPALCHKHYIRFIVGVIVASLIHPTAAVIMLALPLSLFRYNAISNCLVIIFGLAGVLMPSYVLRLIELADFTGHISEYIVQGIYTTGGGSISLSFAMYLIMLIICFYKFEFGHFSILIEGEESDSDTLYYRPLNLGRFETLDTTKAEQGLFWLAGIGVMFQAWVGTVVEFYRIALYFLPAFIFLLPQRMERIEDKQTRSACIFAICICSLAYMLLVSGKNTSIVPYRLMSF